MPDISLYTTKKQFDNELRTQIAQIQRQPALLEKYLKCINNKEELLTYLTDDLSFFINHQWFLWLNSQPQDSAKLPAVTTKGSLSFLTNLSTEQVTFATFRIGGFKTIAPWISQLEVFSSPISIDFLDLFVPKNGIPIQLFDSTLQLSVDWMKACYRHKRSIIPVIAQYTKSSEVLIFFADAIDPNDSHNIELFIKKVTELSFRMLEDTLRSVPEQWILWESLTGLTHQPQPKREKTFGEGWLFAKKYHFNTAIYRIINVNHFLYLFNSQNFTHQYISHSSAKLLQNWAKEGVTRKEISYQLNEAVYQEFFRLQVLI